MRPAQGTKTGGSGNEAKPKLGGTGSGSCSKPGKGRSSDPELAKIELSYAARSMCNKWAEKISLHVEEANLVLAQSTAYDVAEYAGILRARLNKFVAMGPEITRVGEYKALCDYRDTVAIATFELSPTSRVIQRQFLVCLLFEIGPGWAVPAGLG